MKTMANGQSRNPNVGVVIAVVVLGGIAVLLLVAVGIEMILNAPAAKPTLGYMAPLVSTSFCPKVGEKFSVTVKGENAEAIMDGFRLKFVDTQQRLGGSTLFIFSPISEGPVSIHLTSAGYYPETLNLRASRYTEDAWSIRNDTGQQIEILRQVSLKSDPQNRLRFDNQPVGESYPVTNFLFEAKLTGNPEDKQPPVWSSSLNMKLDKERTRGNDFLEMGRYGYRFTTRVWVTRVPNTSGPGWVCVSWMELSRTIAIPDSQPPH